MFKRLSRFGLFGDLSDPFGVTWIVFQSCAEIMRSYCNHEIFLTRVVLLTVNEGIFVDVCYDWWSLTLNHFLKLQCRVKERQQNDNQGHTATKVCAYLLFASYVESRKSCAKHIYLLNERERAEKWAPIARRFVLGRYVTPPPLDIVFSNGWILSKRHFYAFKI